MLNLFQHPWNRLFAHAPWTLKQVQGDEKKEE